MANSALWCSRQSSSIHFFEVFWLDRRESSSCQASTPLSPTICTFSLSFATTYAESTSHHNAAEHTPHTVVKTQERTLPQANIAQENPKDRLGQTSKIHRKQAAGFRLSVVKHNPVQHRVEPFTGSPRPIYRTQYSIHFACYMSQAGYPPRLVYNMYCLGLTCHEKSIEHGVGASLSRGGAWVVRKCLGETRCYARRSHST